MAETARSLRLLLKCPLQRLKATGVNRPVARRRAGAQMKRGNSRLKGAANVSIGDLAKLLSKGIGLIRYAWQAPASRAYFASDR